MKINVPQCRTDKVRTLAEKYSLPLLLATILERRGIEDSEILYYLEDEFLYQNSPFTVDDVYSAIERINEAVDDGENILVFGDRDVDGITATAIVVKCLKKLGAENVDYRLPENDESYGLSQDIVDYILQQGITLVITVDNGISAVDEIKTLEKAGVSVIVTDHHIPGDKLPPATAIFDPKLEGCGYPFADLAGCAVAAKLCWALFFSRTPLFDSPVILLHAEPGNKTIRISVAKIENLIEVDRISDEILEGEKNPTSTALFSFLSCSLPILVLDADVERNMLQKAFGKGVDISLVDIRPQLDSAFPRFRGKSLFELAMVSRAAKYVHLDKELETLISLFKSISINRYPELSKDFEDIMELEAIGTIADLMPMRGENRLIVKKGLKLLSTKGAGPLSYLFAKQNILNKPLKVQDISYKVSPVINAAGRIGHPSVALRLLLSENDGDSEELTDMLFDFNSQRQQSEENALSMVENQAKQSFEEMNGRFILIDDDRIPRGLTGTIASKLANEYSVPTLVLATMAEGRVSASLRCQEPWNAREFLADMSYLFDDYGGHKFAAGFSMNEENKSELLQEVKSKVLSSDSLEEKELSIDIDAEIPAKYMNLDIWNLNRYLEPYGQENAPLRLYIRDAVIEDIYSLGSNPKHVRMMIRHGDYAWTALWWNCENKEEFFKGRHVRVIFSPDMNYWKGVGKEQLLIEYMEAL